MERGPRPQHVPAPRLLFSNEDPIDEDLRTIRTLMEIQVAQYDEILRNQRTLMNKTQSARLLIIAALWAQIAMTALLVYAMRS